jgi:hypothetical protein
LRSPKYTFSAENYDRSRHDYAAQWQVLDAYLYRLCRERPDHTSPLSVNAKIYIIGRTYQTGIERKIRTKGTQASAISQVIELFLRSHEILDPLFLRLSGISEPLTTFNVSTILEIHGCIVELLSQVAIERQSPRSFVSKYMHFHNPVVPIYDSVAADVLPHLARVTPEVRVDVPTGADSDYARYVGSFLKVYQVVARDLAVTVRSLDYYMLWEHDNYWNRQLARHSELEEATALSPSGPRANGQ